MQYFCKFLKCFQERLKTNGFFSRNKLPNAHDVPGIRFSTEICFKEWRKYLRYELKKVWYPQKKKLKFAEQNQN